MGRKVCLSGFASFSREEANEQPPETEIWGMNEGHTFLTRPPERWFQIHPRGWHPNKVKKYGFEEGNYGRPPEHITWMAEQTCPIYMQVPDPRIPSAVKYPLDEIIERYGRYMTSTIAYMLALLLYEHESAKWWKPWTWKNRVESVILTGIEMGIGTEYMIQRPCVEYFLGRLQQAGVEILNSSRGTAMLHGMLYAVDHDSPILEGDLIPVYAASLVDGNMPIVKAHEDDEIPAKTA